MKKATPDLNSSDLPTQPKNNRYLNAEQKMGFIRVAAVTLPLKVGDVDYNTDQIIQFAKRADKQNTQIIIFPELALTGYTLGDLFQQQIVLDKVKDGLINIADASLTIQATMIIGLPFAHEGNIYNIAAVVSRGSILGLAPKTYIPGYKEFYEERWFSSSRDIVNKEADLFGKKIPIGADILFKDKDHPEIVLGVEICEDLWGPLPPSSFQVLAGANIIANLSASNELVGKSDYRRELVSQQSARGICAYIYSSCGVHESTTDVVFSGHCLIAEDGVILSESKRFQLDGEIIINEIDIEHLQLNRERTTSFSEGSLQQFKDIGHVATSQDVTYQNVQARYRTMILMNKANQLKGLVLGTGDLSEIALGWNTFTGDQISHYNVNAGVPKTLVKYLVEWVSNQETFAKAKEVLTDILNTPISPELVKTDKNKINQKTEAIIGPYELHDFFLYHFVRWGSRPSKILFIAEKAFAPHLNSESRDAEGNRYLSEGFGKKYTKEIIRKWLKVFIERFFGNQWKRSVMPDGPKVGSVALSPRGDWRMPSDAEVSLWIKNLN